MARFPIRNVWRWTVVSVALILFAGVGYYGYWDLVQYRFTTITRHQLYQSAQMPPEKLLRLADKHGIRTVIDLRTAEDAAAIEAERIALTDSPVAYFHLPMKTEPDKEYPDDKYEDTILRFLEIVGNPQNRPVLVHCHHGSGRAVLLASIFRVEFENWDRETARRAVEPFHWRGNFSPSAPKGQYLLSYERRTPTVTFATN